jgi:hypothetical protein
MYRDDYSRGISGTTHWADEWSFCNFANAISAHHLAKSPADLREARATNLWHRSFAFRSYFLLLRSAVRALQVHFVSASVARSIHHLPAVIVRDDDHLQRLIGRKNPAAESEVEAQKACSANEILIFGPLMANDTIVGCVLLSLNPTAFALQLLPKFNNYLGNNPMPDTVLDLIRTASIGKFQLFLEVLNVSELCLCIGVGIECTSH